MMLTKQISRHNFIALLWHAGFLALAQNFIDVDTVIPGMIIDSGGNTFLIGVMTAIMLGGSSFTQLFFAPYVSNKKFKQKFLLLGINSRILALFGLGFLLFYSQKHQINALWLIFLFITLFALGGAFANVSYNDILGKSLYAEQRKIFLSTKQILSGVIVLVSAFFAKYILTLHVYPLNYAFMLLIGATSLFLASGGFWSIKEVVPSQLKIKGFSDFKYQLLKELRENPRLKYFLGFINTQGIAISFLPFVMLYAKNIFETGTNATGQFLLFKMIGIVLVSVMVLLGAKKIKYNILLVTNVLLTIFMSLLLLFFKQAFDIKYIFMMGGIVYSLYSITMNGLLLEVSGTKNRTLYTGFAGAGNILPALFPLIGGAVINTWGFHVFFVMFIAVIATALFFIYKIDCKK